MKIQKQLHILLNSGKVTDYQRCENDAPMLIEGCSLRVRDHAALCKDFFTFAL